MKHVPAIFGQLEGDVFSVGRTAELDATDGGRELAVRRHGLSLARKDPDFGTLAGSQRDAEAIAVDGRPQDAADVRSADSVDAKLAERFRSKLDLDRPGLRRALRRGR